MRPHIPRPIRDNLRFLVVEVGSQLSHLENYFETASPSVARRILDRSGYAYNLKQRIHSSCLTQLSRSGKSEGGHIALRSLESIASDLDRISEHCRECVHQMAYIRRHQHLDHTVYADSLRRVVKGIELIEPAMQDNDTDLALKIGRIEQRLDQTYRKHRTNLGKRLKQGKNTDDLITALFMAHGVERMGDALLSISEAIISANLGQPMDIGRYRSLRASVEQLNRDEELSDLVVQPIAETRSGSAISGISDADNADEGYVAIFKDGQKAKVKEEREGVESWHEIYPGLAPRILSYHKRGQSAALLIEHLAGQTFEQILLHEETELLEETLEQLSRTLLSVWKETRSKESVAAGFTRQLSKRLGDVYGIHPEFELGPQQVCGRKQISFADLLDKAKAYEKQLPAPFSVYIHGDFNVDNIIYDPLERKINFIDLHRSRYMDYVQDVSVFMVSNYRLQVLDAPLRRRIMSVACEFYRFARKFADKSGDRTFELRLALGLARSFATSTRFILDKSLARAMFLRARYLIERVLETKPGKAERFRLPIEEIFIG